MTCRLVRKLPNDQLNQKRTPNKLLAGRALPEVTTHLSSKAPPDDPALSASSASTAPPLAPGQSVSPRSGCREETSDASASFLQIVRATRTLRRTSCASPRSCRPTLTAFPSNLSGNQPVHGGCTRQFFSKSFLGDGAAVLARSSGEEPASPRHRAGVACVDGVEDGCLTIQLERRLRKFDFHTAPNAPH